MKSFNYAKLRRCIDFVSICKLFDVFNVKESLQLYEIMLLRIRWRSQVVDKLNDLSVDWIALPELFVAHSIVELIFRLFFIAVKRSSFPVEVRLAYACRHSPTV